MIQLEKPSTPQALIDNENKWKSELLAAISLYGGYEKIPDNEKNQLLSPYKQSSIRDLLFESSFNKCAFCECFPTEGGNLEVEHFQPKSKYPELTFSWDNLLPSCTRCNTSKLAHDTGIEPIINPYKKNPEEVFWYDDIELKAADGVDYEEAKMTIDVCGLNSIRLYRPRADILISLRIFTKAIADAIEDYENSDTDRKKVIRLRKLQESIRTIESLTTPSAKYSGFCKFYINKCDEYIKAKNIIKNA